MTPDEPQSTLPAPDDQAPGSASRSNFQFTTRTLLALTFAASAFLAIAKGLGFGWAIGITWFAAMIAAHVLANSLGTKIYQADSPPEASDSREEANRERA
ncbi:MAG: hypothetical protein N2C14_10320, partial [Planctomycetales bacterium]